MKKESILLSFVLFSATSIAQIQKGNWLFEGSIGNISLYNSNSVQNNSNGQYSSKLRSLAVTLAPRAGWFLSDRFCVGAGLQLSVGYLSSKEVDHLSNTQTLNTDSKRFGVSPFIRYYVGPATSKLRFYLQAEGHYDWGVNKTRSSSYYDGNVWSLSQSKNTSSSIGGAFGVGVNYFISDNVALNSGIAFHYMNWLPPVLYQHQWRMNWGIGFSFFLNGNKKQDELQDGRKL